MFDAVPIVDPPPAPVGSERIRLPGGLVADVVSLGGARVRTEAVVADGRYRYRFALGCAPAEFADGTREFARVVSSLRPIWDTATADLHPFTTWKD